VTDSACECSKAEQLRGAPADRAPCNRYEALEIVDARSWERRLHSNDAMASSASVGRRLQDCCLGLFSVGFVLACLAIINESVRKSLLDALHGDFSTIVPGTRVHAVTKHVADMLPHGDPTLLFFAAAALVLTIIMFRA
jgi:hypothetical protein